jgi:hypothetical protein
MPSTVPPSEKWRSGGPHSRTNVVSLDASDEKERGIRRSDAALCRPSAGRRESDLSEVPREPARLTTAVAA